MKTETVFSMMGNEYEIPGRGCQCRKRCFSEVTVPAGYKKQSMFIDQPAFLTNLRGKKVVKTPA